jgi:hypothetical protein
VKLGIVSQLGDDQDQSAVVQGAFGTCPIKVQSWETELGANFGKLLG